MVVKTMLCPWIERFFPWITKIRYRRFMNRIVANKSIVAVGREYFNCLFESPKHTFSREYSVAADAPDRISLLVSEAQRDIQHYSSGQCKNLLFYIFSPKTNELLMDELHEIDKWLSDNEESQIQWGYGGIEDDKIRMIVIWN